MAEILATLLVLACPIGMASMMFVPALARRFGRRRETARTGTTDSVATSTADARHLDGPTADHSSSTRRADAA